MTGRQNTYTGDEPDPVHEGIAALLGGTTTTAPDELTRIVDMAGRIVGARSARLLVADYSLLSLQALGEHGPTGPRQPIEGTLAGRCFAHGEIVVSVERPGLVWVPLSEGSERLGVLEFDHPDWHDDLDLLVVPVVRVLALVFISKRRYTDVVLRRRRSEPLSLAAEMQWDLLPPLTCSTERASLSGILEPAYSIGGDSFDFAFNPGIVDFAIVDAMGRGMAAVLLSVAAINSLRNARREQTGLTAAYLATGATLEAQFSRNSFVTGQFGTLAPATGELTWVNAGHPLPLLVRDGSFVGELACRPSLPMGLGGPVVEVATERLQPGDRVLFYTDGVTESRSPAGEEFGVARLADLLVRASGEAMPPAETVRRLSASIVRYNGPGLSDDATLLLLEYHGPANYGGPRR